MPFYKQVLEQYDKLNVPEKGRGYFSVVATLVLLIVLLILIFPAVKHITKVSREVSDARKVKAALENKIIDLGIYHGIIVPQGWGGRGTEGKLLAVRQAREKRIPYLGLCFGMQMAVIEFARNVANLKGANSTEADSQTAHPVIHVMPEQAEYLAKKQYGGTIRLGSWPAVLKNGSTIKVAYKKYTTDKSSPWLKGKDFQNKSTIYERHRHRYEFNNEYREQLEKTGLIISGLSPDGQLVESIELSNHPFFVGTQFHPEYIARPLTPHPLFLAFISACRHKKTP